MSIFDGVLGRLGWVRWDRVYKTNTLDDPSPWQEAYASSFKFGLPEPKNALIQADYYRKLSWIAIAVQLLAQSAAAVKFKVKTEVGEELKEIANHPFEQLLNQPNPLQSRFEFLESWFSYRILTGNGYAWLNRDSADQPPSEIWSIPTDLLNPLPDGKMFIKGYEFTAPDGQVLVLPPWQIVHLKRFNPLNMFLGLSPIESIYASANNDLAMVNRHAKFNSEENGRLPGILAFGDNFTDPEWNKMKKDIDDKANKMRQYMMLRNVKPGGVSWVQTAMSSRDAQYIESRTFTKEEIYSLFAPGLASMLAVNATEANSKSGKATFAEYAIWPLLDSAAQKITNDILPAYGDDLTGEFDEVRVKDRVMELSEEKQYAETHTIAEIRKKFYNDDPIGDERDELLPAQVLAYSRNQAPAAIPGAVPVNEPGGEATPTTQPIEAGDQGMENSQGMPQSDAVEEELMKWRRVQLKAMKAGKPGAVAWTPEHIPPALFGAVKGQLTKARDEAAVNRIFRNAILWRNY